MGWSSGSGSRRGLTAPPRLAHDLAILVDHAATHEGRFDRSAGLEAGVRRVADLAEDFRVRDLTLRVEVDDRDVGVAANLEAALLREVEPCRWLGYNAIIRSFVREDRLLADPSSRPWQRYMAQRIASLMEGFMK